MATEAEAKTRRSENVLNNGARSSGPHSCRHRHYDKQSIEGILDIRLRGIDYGLPEIDIDAFVDYLLPPLKYGVSTKSVVPSLRSEGLITPQNKWRHFDRVPSDTADEEDIIFSPLSEICERVVHYTSSNVPNLEQTFVLSLLRDTQPDADEASTVRPDGYFILREAEELAKAATNKKDKARWWYDIALTAEFRKEETYIDRDDNVSNIVFNMQQTMTLDPCRRFTFGITIENINMRLWFSSRAVAIVSKPFDFTSSTHLLTRIFLSFSYASKEELGWDPTIRTCIGNDGLRAYHIDVGDQTFETEHVFSEAAADALVSRATRVWRAKLLGSEDRYVLKDVWMDDDRDFEHDVYKRMLRDIEEKYGKETRKEAESHLLTPVVHWVVPVNGEEDHTTKVMMRGYTPSFESRFKLKIKDPKTSGAIQVVLSSAAGDKRIYSDRRRLEAPFPRRINYKRLPHRIHYRIVFKEEAKTIDKVKRLSDVFVILRDSAKVLEWMHGCGWVHRDISVGNLYYYEGRGVVGDLEYARRRNFDVANEVWAGTPVFMALESAKREYFFIESKGDEDPEAWILEQVAKAGKGEFCPRRPAAVSPPFFHNDLHDLESLWWVAMWELVFNGDRSDMDLDEKRAREREDAALQLFQGSSVINHRTRFLKHSVIYQEMLSWTGRTLYAAKEVLDCLRATLVQQYKAFESEFPAISTDILQITHAGFRRMFELCINYAGSIELVDYRTVSVEHTILTPVNIDHATQDLTAQICGPYTEDERLCEISGRNSSSGSSQSTPVISDSSDTRNCSLRIWRLINDDFLTPMPALCAARYELEVR